MTEIELLQLPLHQGLGGVDGVGLLPAGCIHTIVTDSVAQCSQNPAEVSTQKHGSHCSALQSNIILSSSTIRRVISVASQCHQASGSSTITPVCGHLLVAAEKLKMAGQARPGRFMGLNRQGTAGGEIAVEQWRSRCCGVRPAVNSLLTKPFWKYCRGRAQ